MNSVIKISTICGESVTNRSVSNIINKDLFSFPGQSRAKEG